MTKTGRQALQALVLSLALIVFWFACVANFHAQDMILGAPSIIVAVVFSFYAIRKLPIRFRPSLTNILELWRLPAYVVIDLAQILLVLARDLAGRRASSLFRSAPWRANSDSPSDLARRALAVGYTTVSPNCVVIGIDRGRHQFFFHQLKASPIPVMTRRLGAGDLR